MAHDRQERSHAGRVDEPAGREACADQPRHGAVKDVHKQEHLTPPEGG
jgi:hypothetical protein